MDAERKRQGKKEERKEGRKEHSSLERNPGLDFNQLKNVLLNIVVIRT